MFLDARNPPQDIAGYDPTRDAGDTWYDEEAAEKAVSFFPRVLQYVEGHRAGEPFNLEDWQANIVRTLFGWKQPDGRRRYRTAYITVARKNGKTTFIAGLALYVLFCDGERRAQCYCGASNREQATLLFDIASTMCRHSTLESRCKIRDGLKRIIFRDSFLKAIPANEGGSHGYSSQLIVGDELHTWEGERGRQFYNVLHTSTGARTQPLEIYITTAGFDRNSVCYSVHTKAKQVRDGKVSAPQFLPVIYEVAEEDDWQDPNNWKKANPNLGISVFEDYLRTEAQQAAVDQLYENTFRRLHLNQWTSQESRWLAMHQWRACPSDGDITPGSPVYGGLDLSSNVDVTAWVLAAKHGSGWKIRGHYFIPEGRMREAIRRDHVPYDLWAKAGWVTATPGDAIDYDYVHRRILEDSRKYNIGAIGYDPWNAEPTRIYLENKGLQLIKMRQGMATLSTPCKELERCVIEGCLDHGGDPVLEWMAENVQVKDDDNGNIRPVKPEHHASGKRIDGIVAAVMAIGVGQTLNPTRSTGKVMFV